jgi:hypothetical protein
VHRFLPSVGTKRVHIAFRYLARSGSEMTRAEQYRRYAAQCLRVAQETSNPNDKALLLEMAQKWRELAEKTEREDGSN